MTRIVQALSLSLVLFVWGCDSVSDPDETFNFLNVQALSLPISIPAEVLVADINGDGNQDLVWNHLSDLNETVVALSNGNGAFTIGSRFVHPASPPDGWEDFTVRVGDFNNDGADDLAWGRVFLTNTTYIGLSNGDGTFEDMPAFTRAGTGWGVNYDFVVGDIDGRSGDDLIWNEVVPLRNRTYVSFSNGDGTYGVNNQEGTTDAFHDHPVLEWNSFLERAVEDIDGDGDDDLLWYTQGFSQHIVLVGESVSSVQGSVFNFLPQFDRGTSRGWEDYDVVVGNINGQSGADLIWVASGRELPPIHRDLTEGSGDGLAEGPLQEFDDGETEGPYELRLFDFNGDGRMDLLMNLLSDVNRVFVGLGQEDGTFNFTELAPQDHPDSEVWGRFNLLIGDFNGDGRDDVIYNNPNASNPVYVGLGGQVLSNPLN